MAKYTNTTVEEIVSRRTANSSTYKCTVSRINGSYFGYCHTGYSLAIKAYNSYKYNWGFPEKSAWKASWGTLSYYLEEPGRFIDCGFGELEGLAAKSYTWEEEVPINRGNSRQGSISITVGIKANKNNSSLFPDDLKTITLSTTEIPKATLNSFEVTADPNTINERYIHIAGTYSNPENYFTARVYNQKTPGSYVYISEEGDTSFNFSVPITEDMYNTSQRYVVEIVGKDSVIDVTGIKDATVQPSGVGLAVKIDNVPREVSTAHLWNVTTKDIPEIWIKIDDKIIKTIK